MTTLSLLAWCASLTGFAAPFPTLVDPRVRDDLSQALSTVNMTVADFTFLKDIGEPRLAIEWNRQAVRDPLIVPIRAQALANALAGAPDHVWQSLPGWLDVNAATPRSTRTPDGRSTPLTRFVETAQVAAGEIAAGLSALTPDEQNELAADMLSDVFDLAQPPTMAAAAEAGLPTQLLRRVAADSQRMDRRIPAEARLALIEKVDRGRLLAAGRAITQAAEDLALAAAAWTNWPDHVQTIETPLGAMQIGTQQDDSYDKAALLILDPAGNDRYREFAGSAVGSRRAPVAVIIDLAGDDDYQSTQLIGAGAALLGAAVLIDSGGNDRYDASFAGQGASILGSAILRDLGGDDRYRAANFAQGAAILGIGWLHDGAGDDVYELGKQGQAFAGLFGAGLLADLQGNDRYVAGGATRDTDRNDDRFQSLAQGFAIGERPFWGGGIAALYDGGGNDTYIADVFGQGAAYWYGSAFLLDAAGDDTYTAHQYAQGAGIHLATGLLADLSGNDVYVGAILAQAAAHDYGVGMLFDRAGHDSYEAESSSQGRAMNNGLALLVEGGGDDRYHAQDNSSCQGIGNEGGHRDYGALGILLDQGGNDAYSAGAMNGKSTPRPLYGVIHDTEAAP